MMPSDRSAARISGASTSRANAPMHAGISWMVWLSIGMSYVSGLNFTESSTPGT